MQGLAVAGRYVSGFELMGVKNKQILLQKVWEKFSLLQLERNNLEKNDNSEMTGKWEVNIVLFLLRVIKDVISICLMTTQP